MPIELESFLGSARLSLPERSLAGLTILSLYLTLLFYLFYRYRRALAALTWRRWLATLGLALAAAAFGRLSPVPFSLDTQFTAAAAQNPTAMFVLFAAVPYLLAAVALNPLAAIIVGFCGGLGRAVWQTHLIFDPFHYAFAAALASWCLQQNYMGRFYRWLRQPVVVGPLSAMILPPLLGVAAFAYSDPTAGFLTAFDMAMATTAAHVLPLFIEGLLGGVVVYLLLMGVPHWRPALPLTPAPESRSLRRRLVSHFLVFAVLVMAFFLTGIYFLAINVSTRLVVNQMAHNAHTVSAAIPQFRANRQNLLTQFSTSDQLLSDDAQAKAGTLRQLFRTGPFYRRVVLVDAASRVNAFYPADKPSVNLTEVERIAIADALASGVPAFSPGQSPEEDQHVISVIVPVFNENQPAAVLVGRVPGISLNELIIGLQGTVGQGSGFIVDETDRIIAHSDRNALLAEWQPPAGDVPDIRTDYTGPGKAYEGRHSTTNARELVYYLEGEGHPWTVVTTAPYDVVLRLALQIGWPLSLLLALAMGLFGVHLGVITYSVTNPLTQLARAAQRVARGENETPVIYDRADEVGQLSQALAKMQTTLKGRVDELALLLNVMQKTSGSLDLNQGVQEILRGALRMTGAAGARMVMLNPSSQYPLLYGEGPAAGAMAFYDRKMMMVVNQRGEMILPTPAAVEACLEPPLNRPAPFQAALALPLLTTERSLGILWLGYLQPHEFNQSELELLHALASQATITVERARLYAMAEGGRRRLAAVLASTADAVIVTDATRRILLLNPAMERAFALKADEVVGRPVVHVIKDKGLLEAMTQNTDRSRNLEVAATDGRTLYANASTIQNAAGQVMGRVAVLHDITYLKELDTLKSEFVQTVSHDLRDPLTIMRGYAGMLSMVGDLNDKQRAHLDKIQESIDQMIALVSDLLDLGRIEAGVDLMLSEVQVGLLLQSVASGLAQRAQVNGTPLKVLVAANLPVMVGDASLIRQAVTNLVNNAIKYTPHSGEITLRAAVEGDTLVISVQDNGPGIAKENQMRIFEKFYRIRQKGEGKEGSGLGLAIVKSIAERHGGRAWVESEVGQGSVFCFTLPVKRGE